MIDYILMISIWLAGFVVTTGLALVQGPYYATKKQSLLYLYFWAIWPGYAVYSIWLAMTDFYRFFILPAFKDKDFD